MSVGFVIMFYFLYNLRTDTFLIKQNDKKIIQKEKLSDELTCMLFLVSIFSASERKMWLWGQKSTGGTVRTDCDK